MTKKIRKSVLLVVITVAMMFAMCIMASAATPQLKMAQTGGTETSITIQYQMFTDFDGYYVIQVSESNTYANAKTEWEYAGTNESYITGLNPGTLYYVRLGITGRDGAMPPNDDYWVGQTTAITKPDEVRNLRFTDAGDTTVTISWDASKGATKYAIQYVGSTYYTTSTSFALPFAENGSSYNSAYVYAMKENGSDRLVSGAESIWGMSPLSSKPSKDQIGLTAIYSGLSKVSFGTNAKGMGYEVELAPKSGKKVTLVSGDTTSSIDRKVKKNMLYKYRMRSFVTLSNGAKKYSEWSDYRTFMLNGKMKYVSRYGGIDIKWSKLKGISKIEIQVSDKEKSGFKTVAKLKGTATSYRLTKYKKKALKKGKRWYFRVYYYDKFGSKKLQKGDIYSTGNCRV